MGEKQPYDELDMPRHGSKVGIEMPPGHRSVMPNAMSATGGNAAEKAAALRREDFELVIRTIATTDELIPNITRDKQHGGYDDQENR